MVDGSQVTRQATLSKIEKLINNNVMTKKSFDEKMMQW